LDNSSEQFRLFDNLTGQHPMKARRGFRACKYGNNAEIMPC
jgi:hypothetical protein